MKELMADPAAPSSNSLSALLDTYGRVEAIWFPYAEDVWVQCMNRQEEAPSDPVSGPYNYEWMRVPHWVSEGIKLGLIEFPWLIKGGSKVEEFWAQANETDSIAGTSRDLEIYLMDDTLRMGIFGYALQLPRSEVQRVANEFYAQFTSAALAVQR